MREKYRNQVHLLLQVLPLLSKEDALALKGGTAINFFWHDFPRLSVDIDLTYLPIQNRKESLSEISRIVQNLAGQVQRQLPGVRVTKHKSGGTLSKLTITSDNSQIKVEVNTVLRGCIYEPVERELSSTLQDEFELFLVTRSLSFEDLYGGKLCAALDRQHPRDLYDVKLLLDQDRITKRVRTAFIGYLVSHSRPMNELLNPNTLPLDLLYTNEFTGMTHHEIELNELERIQMELPKRLLTELTAQEKEFLVSFKRGKPDWDQIQIPHLKKLPGVQWKLLNIRKMDAERHKKALRQLESVLSS